MAIIPIFISDLEPIAGAGLAVSLAYLALDRFRYRHMIEDAGTKVYKVFSDDGSINMEETLESINDLKWICRKDCNGHAPRGFGPTFYRYSFRRQGDELMIALLGVLSGVSLVSGVAFKIETLSWLQFLETPWIVVAMFYACVASILVPAAAVLSGRRCVRWGREFAEHCEKQINLTLKNSARAAETPVPAPHPVSGGATQAALRAGVRMIPPRPGSSKDRLGD